MPDSATKKEEGELNAQATLCQEEIRDEVCVHTIDAPGTHHDARMHANNTYDEELIASDTLATNEVGFAAATLAVYNEEYVAVDTLTTSDKKTATTIDDYNERFAAATLATNDEGTTAVEGEPWGA